MCEDEDKDEQDPVFLYGRIFGQDQSRPYAIRRGEEQI